MDQHQRENKLVILGVPDENLSLEGATNDDAKLSAVLDAIGELPSSVSSHRRLGRPNDNRPRPILCTVASREVRDNFIDKARRLNQNPSENIKKIRIKKDSHPVVRKEWARLHEVVKKAREDPVNVGIEVRLDVKERKVYRGDTVIDSWHGNYF